jgi:chromosome segregation ATPase
MGNNQKGSSLMNRLGRTGITYEDVMEAVNAIQNRGELPTIDRVRGYLGGKGSNTTISKYLNCWRHNIVPSGNEKYESSEETPPDIVQSAIQHAWQQIKAKADQEIEAVKAESQAQIQLAEERTHQAEAAFKKLQEQYEELEQIARRDSAQKEILSLDLKRLQEEHNLLDERFRALQERYTDMQGLSTQHLKDLYDAHAKEVSRLEEKCQVQENKYGDMLSEMKKRLEDERHDHMRALDTVKEENKKLNKVLPELLETIKQQSVEITQLRADLKSLHEEKTSLESQLEQDQGKWQLLENKISLCQESFINVFKDTSNHFNVFKNELIENLDQKIWIHYQDFLTKKVE